MRYAVVNMAGTQQIVREGEVLTIPKLEVEPEASLRFDEVLLLKQDSGLAIGRPKITGAHVEAKATRHLRSRKITTFKFIRRENYRRKKGHRQQYTEVQITKIAPAGA